MTRDGLVEQNLDTGEEIRVSQRGQDFNLRQESPPEAEARPPGASRSHRQAQAAPETEPPQEVRRDIPLRRQTAREDGGAGAAKRNRAAYREYGDGRQPISPVPDSGRETETAAPAQQDAEPRTEYEPEVYGRHEGLPVTEGAEYSAPSPVHLYVDLPRPASPRQRGTDYARRFTPEAQPPPPHYTRQADARQPDTPKPAEDVPDDSGAPHSMEPDRPGRLLFSEDAGQPPRAERKPSAWQRGTEYARRFTPEARASPAPGEGTKPPAANAAATTAANAEPVKPSRLQFAPGESAVSSAPNKIPQRLQNRAEATSARPAQERDSLPAKDTAGRGRVRDGQKGKSKRKIQFESRPLVPGEKLRSPPAAISAPAAVGKTGARAAAQSVRQGLHHKVHEVERENAGVETAHRAEQAGEAVIRGGVRSVRAAYSFHKNTPYRAADKLGKQARKANGKLMFHKAGAKGGVTSRIVQKRNIKKRYANAYRAARNAAKRAGTAAKKTGQAAVSAVKSVVTFTVSHPVAAGVIAAVLLVVFFFFSLFSSCANMAAGAFSTALSSSYVADDAEIDGADFSYTAWEMDLREQIENAEADHAGYDEYRYDVDESSITHDPFALMAYLTAKYQDFQYAGVEADLREIFAEQYSRTFTPQTETRYNDPGDSDNDGDREPYEWHILNIKLTVKPFADILAGRMDAAQKELYGVYMDTRGNRQYIINPFAFDWEPYISCLYGWRVHPVTGARDNHTGIDIAVAAGTPILAGQDGVVSIAGDNGDYGLMVQIDGENSLSSRYAHCSELLVTVGQEVEKGDVIAKVGSTGMSTGPHLHLEVVKDGVRLNPIFFAESQ